MVVLWGSETRPLPKGVQGWCTAISPSLNSILEAEFLSLSDHQPHPLKVLAPCLVFCTHHTNSVLYVHGMNKLTASIKRFLRVDDDPPVTRGISAFSPEYANFNTDHFSVSSRKATYLRPFYDWSEGELGQIVDIYTGLMVSSSEKSRIFHTKNKTEQYPLNQLYE